MAQFLATSRTRVTWGGGRRTYKRGKTSAHTKKGISTSEGVTSLSTLEIRHAPEEWAHVSNTEEEKDDLLF